ncbi:type II secretion system minor pseudopilin GspJ [Azovibrio restrictus]|uniref:type II secretion system minor pseudopilin GspJ n=1 Tax=Azovibrio restrictus TaxID=146938 RepID=UPI0026EE1ECA|nr:type II secretion system minor pseudopilin GspJ [Azovibrio restrictus]MDD3484666.1 type II secretion system minor pseudopilin GspJ [Azovibrio restrictus]
MSGVRAQSRGFTLLEILVAVSLLAIMAVLAYRGLEAMQRSTAHVEQSARRWQDLARALERFARDLQQPAARPGRQEDGSAAPPWWGRPGEGTQPQLTLSRLGNEGMDTQRLAHRWHQGRWEMLFWPSPESPAGDFQAYPLLEGVELLELQYLDSRQQWHASWPVDTGPNANPFPRAVRLHLRLAEGGDLERLVDIPVGQ